MKTILATIVSLGLLAGTASASTPVLDDRSAHQTIENYWFPFIFRPTRLPLPPNPCRCG